MNDSDVTDADSKTIPNTGEALQKYSTVQRCTVPTKLQCQCLIKYIVVPGYPTDNRSSSTPSNMMCKPPMRLQGEQALSSVLVRSTRRSGSRAGAEKYCWIVERLARRAPGSRFHRIATQSLQ